MRVKELIQQLLDCDMNDDVEILLSKGKTVQVHSVHDCSTRSFMYTGVNIVTIEPIDDLKRLDE